MAQFTDEQLQTAQDVIEAAIREQFPNISVRIGTVMKELVAKGSALGQAVITRTLEEFKATDSLSAIENNPEAIDDSIIDAILSNWFLTRKQGKKASGVLRIDMATDRSLFINSNTAFTSSNALVYITLSDFIVEKQLTTAASIQLQTDTSTGLFYFLLPVTAEEVGEQYSIAQGTQLDTTALGADLILVTAFTDFAGGTTTESSSELLARAKSAITVRDLVTTKSIKAVLAEAFTSLESIAVIGYGDPEMIRDHIGNLGFGAGGRVDIYTRNTRDPVMTTLTKTVSSSSTFALDAVPTEVPFYRVESIVPVDTPGIEITDFTVAFSLVTNPPNDLQDKLHNGRFTIYERAVVTLNTPGYEGMDVLVKLTQPPQIQDIQAYVLDEDNRVVSADLLVKAPIPVFVTINLELVRPLFGEPIDLDGIKNALKTYINTIQPGDELNLSVIIQIVQGFGIIRVNFSNLNVKGELHKPDGTVAKLTAGDSLIVPTDRSIGMSQNNAVYYITLDDIVITELAT